MLLRLSGAFLDVVHLCGHGGVFANAVTGNVVLLGVFAASGDRERSDSLIIARRGLRRARDALGRAMARLAGALLTSRQRDRIPARRRILAADFSSWQRLLKKAKSGWPAIPHLNRSAPDNRYAMIVALTRSRRKSMPGPEAEDQGPDGKCPGPVLGSGNSVEATELGARTVRCNGTTAALRHRSSS